MPLSLPPDLAELLDQKVFAHVATVGPDGWPHSTVMWIARQGDRILLNTAVGRAKWRNLQRDPRVSISLSPPDRPYVNYSIKGRVIEMRTADGDEVIDALAHKYLGTDTYPNRRPGEVRVTIIVEPLAVAPKH